MSTHEQKKYYRKKKQQKEKRKQLIKKYSVIALVLVAITLAIVLPATLIERDPNTNSDNTNTSSNTARYTLMDLGSKGCIPCDNLQPVLDSLRIKYSGTINIKYYDVNNSTTGARLGNEYNVSTIPTLIYLDNDREVYRSVGYKSQNEIEAAFRRLGWI